MSEPFLGEVKIVSFNFAPKGWASCNGQLLPINQNQALFSILGTLYGGDGRVNFALPNLQGKIPIHAGPNFVQGQFGGESDHILFSLELPPHTHAPTGSSAPPSAGSPAGNLWATASSNPFDSSANTSMNPAAVLPVGGNQPHENMPPYLVLNFVIALQGIFPSRT